MRVIFIPLIAIRWGIYLIGWVARVVLLGSILAGLVGVIWFLFSPQDTPIGHNTSRFELIRREVEVIREMPADCQAGYAAIALTFATRRFPLLVAYGAFRTEPVFSMLRGQGIDQEAGMEIWRFPMYLVDLISYSTEYLL